MPTEPGPWQEGLDEIGDMVTSGALDHDVHSNPADVDAMFDDAQSHLNSAATLKDSDPRGAYSVMYMGARKALVAALLKQGLRARGGEGGHRTVYEAIHAQLGRRASRVVEPFDRMRRKRNQADYDAGSPIEAADVDEDLPKARMMVERIRVWSRLLGRWHR